ncbi:MAG: uracil-DNA glycosylase [Actinomycetota bacterium]|nr:MAG: uracil-DNA glycosylase [Actinomycetota bacterium]
MPSVPEVADDEVAHDADAVRRLAASAGGLAVLDARVSVCRACPRLVGWREEVARTRRRAFAAESYWGRPVPGWGDAQPRILVVGLAPAAHGGNRTGRIFTGDRSGDWLFASLHRVGLASIPTSVSAGDGQQLFGVRMVAAVRCAPPANKPTPAERDTCAPWLDTELEFVLAGLRAVVALGRFAWDASLAALRRAGLEIPSPRPAFGHGAAVDLAKPGGLTVLGSYHPSQQNTFTGRLTADMLDDVLGRAARLAGRAGPPPAD